MNKKELAVIHVVSTILFQEGFDRWDSDDRIKNNVKSLEKWEYPKRSLIESYIDDEDFEYGSLNLSTKRIDDAIYLELWEIRFEEDDDGYISKDFERNILLYIPINPERLCWDMYKYVEIICKYLNY